MQYIKVYMLASGWLNSQTVQIGRMAATFVKEKGDKIRQHVVSHKWEQR